MPPVTRAIRRLMKSPLDNFEDLEGIVGMGRRELQRGKAAARRPSYIDGRLYTVAGPRRYVVSIDPGDRRDDLVVLTVNRVRNAFRILDAGKDYGKGIAYAEVDGRGVVIYISSPAFFPDGTGRRDRPTARELG